MLYITPISLKLTLSGNTVGSFSTALLSALPRLQHLCGSLVRSYKNSAGKAGEKSGRSCRSDTSPFVTQVPFMWIQELLRAQVG